MKKIPLSQGKFALVDDADFERVSKFKWTYSKTGKSRGYAVRNEKLAVNKWGRVLLHRFVTDAPKDKIVDHINHDTLDCRQENLRVCTVGENARNVHPHSDSRSGLKGVHQVGNRFRSNIFVDGVHHHIGYFATAIEAARAYNAKAQDLHKEFALPNVLNTYA